ncbi:nuclear transport factor 2 family protein [Azotobacter beijerinckii]|uniref:nuclear transport factor 2 family protein n=1 Tax=Azotobacter beijerinckii TaxID=170623 RepID=UPI002954293D|nr:nuclear transport factor 2 family protein [Azotobacter beijerinckii]MDV7212909.1 nuclear transport factor 2 family protein [Azotobacter beijerinckii]
MIKRIIPLAAAFCSMALAISPASAADETAAVDAAAEQLRVAMVDPDKGRLEALIAPQLSYGHASGKVDTKESLIDNLMSGASNFSSIAISDQSVQVVGDDIAIVRHTFVADTHGKGKDPARVNLKVLQIWKKTGSEWQLLARQAVTAGA